MSLRKENTRTCHNDRLVISGPAPMAFSRTMVELSEQDLARVMGGDGPSGIGALHNGRRPGFPVRPGVSGGPGRFGFPPGPALPRGWCAGADPELDDGLGPWSAWGLC